MVLRKIFLAAASLILLGGCSSDELANTTGGSKTPGVTISAGMDEGTRVSFTPYTEGAERLKVAWESSDALFAVVSSSTNTGNFTVSQIQSDVHKANFTGTFDTPLTQSSEVSACVKTASSTVSGTGATFEWSTQTGVAADLGKYDILTGNGNYEPSGTSPIHMHFDHQMSFLKATVILPVAATGNTATVTLKGTGLPTSVVWNGNTNTFSDLKTGNITLTAAPVNGTEVTVYAALYPGTVKELCADVTVDGTTYGNLLVTHSATLEAGKLYTVSRNASSIEDIKLWIPDAAWSKVIDCKNYKIASVAREPEEGSDWLNVSSDGTHVTLSADANTTGAPRQATLSFTNGSSTTTVDITQIEDKDFAGTWDMTAFKVFYTTGDATITGVGTNIHDNTWSAIGTTPGDGATNDIVKEGVDYGNKQEMEIDYQSGGSSIAGIYQAGTHRQNLSMRGLYENLRTKGSAEVDYSKMSANVYFFIDTNQSNSKNQRLYTGTYAGQYANLMPEFYNTSTSTHWDFQYAWTGGTGYWWYRGDVTVAGHTTKVSWYANGTNGYQNLSAKLRVVGLQVMRYTGPVPSASYIIREPESLGAPKPNWGAYAITYQGDIVMKRTADGYREITIGGDN
ncbi:fimbrillin family protein [Prevotella sp. KH2C16]|uniref:fimbrillin family protein n=1 Tax=Prevotella sp. KH2C16 TaxID=1855325 RepID=UPI0008EB7431|nr:fimbrillin family protein [Prevotella sp. KH2C16]SFG30927.1 Putative binding domain-containing protein, N-terminal [Prevotella sp. KH2C16]